MDEDFYFPAPEFDFGTLDNMTYFEDGGNDMPLFDLSQGFEQTYSDAMDDVWSTDSASDGFYDIQMYDPSAMFDRNLQDIQNAIPNVTYSGGSSDSGFWGNLLQSVTGVVTGVATAVTSYNRTQLPGGGSILTQRAPYSTQIDPRTGYPVNRAGIPQVTVTGQGIKSMLSNPMVLIGLAAGAAMLLSNSGRK